MSAGLTAFVGSQQVAAGSLADVAEQTKVALDERPDQNCFVFDDSTGRQIEIDFRGSVEDVLSRLGVVAPPPARPGRPRLGVVAKEVTLLPRHWEWLAGQSGGASAALRRLVEQARRDSSGEEIARGAQESCFRFMNAVAGDLPGFEEALRALFKGDAGKFDRESNGWPPDVQQYARRLAQPAFSKQ